MKKVIIIGAGPAGITAGYELLKQSGEYEVTILEETSYIGGISRTEVYNEHRMDIGGHRFFSKSQEVNDWWENVMPMQGAPAYDDDLLGRDVPISKGGPDPAKEDRVMLNRTRISHIYYNRRFFEYPVKMNMDTFKKMGFGTTMQAGFSYLGSMVAKKPENSLENYYINQFGKKLYSMFFEGYTEKLWGRHPREIDPSWGAQRTKGLSITEIVKDATRKVFHKQSEDVNTSLIGAFKYPKLGPGQLWEAAAADFEAMGGSIHLNCHVIRINTNGNKVESVTCAVDGITIEEKADIVISSMPIKDLIIGMNNVPPNVTEVARKLPYRDFVTVGLLVPKLRINNTTYMKTLGNVIPDTWIYVQDTGVKMGRIQIFNNWSPYLLKNPEKTVWVGLEYFCNEGDRYWNMTDDEWIQFAQKELVHMGILSESAKVLDAHKVAMKKAYPAYFDGYSRFDEVRTYLDGFENLYCVGRNGQHRYNNMDHSMITSFEAVKNIINGVKDKSNIWNVNTEQEYHETKAATKEEKVVEEKVVETPAPVAPVEEVKPVKAEAPVPPAKKEEELQATVQAVPTPPVRKQIRRVAKAPEQVTESVVVPVQEPVVAEPIPQAEPVVVQPAEVITQEAEIHVSKSRSIWDDVAIAEASASVKTAPISIKATEENVVITKNEKPEVKETVKEEVKEATKEAAKEEVKSVAITETVAGASAEEKPKKTRTRRKKVKEEVEVSAETKPEVTEIAEEVKAEVTEAAEEVKAESTEATEEEKPKKKPRTRRKKAVTEAEGSEAVKEEASVVQEEKPAQELKEEVPEAAEEVTETVKEEKAEETDVKEVKKAEKPAGSRIEKTYADRVASNRASGRSSNRQTSSRRRAVKEDAKVSNIGKEAMVGNMKGTVIKANVVEKKPEESNTASGRKRK